jgi:parvulin-like peptidyl-prolyl isomerase
LAGPITSTFGAHLVRVTERTPAVAPPLADVRAKVQREFEYARRQRARDESYRKLRAQYQVVLETKSPGGRAVNRFRFLIVA